MQHEKIFVVLVFLVVCTSAFAEENSLKNVFNVEKSSYNEAIRSIQSIDSHTISDDDFKILKEQSLTNKDVRIRRASFRKIVTISKTIFEQLEHNALEYYIMMSRDNDGDIRELAVAQLSKMKSLESVKQIIEVLRLEFELPVEKRGSNNPRRADWGKDAVIRECIVSIIDNTTSETVLNYLIEYKGEKEVEYCISHTLYRSKLKKVDKVKIAEGVANTSSSFLKVELLWDINEIADPVFVPVLRQAVTDDFKIYTKEHTWFYPVKNAASTALKRIEEKK